MDINELIVRAESGTPWAQTNLVIRYILGDGVDPDPAKALFWYLKAAKKGEPSALTNARKPV
jgi:TPR repeat protein